MTAVHHLREQIETIKSRAERSRRMRLAARLAPLHTPHRRRKVVLFIGLTLLTLDLCALPITYYYALKFGTNLKLQDSPSPRFYQPETLN